MATIASVSPAAIFILAGLAAAEVTELESLEGAVSDGSSFEQMPGLYLRAFCGLPVILSEAKNLMVLRAGAAKNMETLHLPISQGQGDS